MKCLYLILISLAFFSCDSSVKSEKKVAKTAHTIAKTKKADKPDNTLNLRSVLLGRWSALRDTEAVMSIDTNDIFYYEESTFCKYNLLGNKIKIDFPDRDPYIGIVKLAGKDTLIMIGGGKFNWNDTLHRCRRPL